jgi:hypothetical protein
MRFPTEKISSSARAGRKEREDSDESVRRVYTLRVDLEESPLPKESLQHQISRTIKMRGDQTLELFHATIFRAFDRSEERLYEFNFGDNPFDRRAQRFTSHAHYAGSAREELEAHDAGAVTLDSLGLAKGQMFHYVFDFGDYWVHRIVVDAVETGERGDECPLVIEAVGESPPQFPYPDKEAAGMQQSLEESGWMDSVMQYLQSEWREEIEQKPLRANTKLQAALNKLPSIWVKAICSHVGLPSMRRAKERVAALVASLPRGGSLEAIWSRLPEQSRRIVKWIVLKEGGSVSIQELFEQFGPDTDRSWYWDEGETPETPLGLLRLHGLVYVGMTKMAQEKEKTAVIPVELREGLRRLAGAPDALDEAPPLPGRHDQSPSSVDEEEVKTYLHEILAGTPEENLTEITELEKFLQGYPFSKATEWLYCNVIDTVSSRPRDFHPDAIQTLVERMIAGGKTDSRFLAYKLGRTVFGDKFARPALNDKSSRIRKWAKAIMGDSPDESS